MVWFYKPDNFFILFIKKRKGLFLPFNVRKFTFGKKRNIDHRNCSFFYFLKYKSDMANVNCSLSASIPTTYLFFVFLDEQVNVCHHNCKSANNQYHCSVLHKEDHNICTTPFPSEWLLLLDLPSINRGPKMNSPYIPTKENTDKSTCSHTIWEYHFVLFIFNAELITHSLKETKLSNPLWHRIRLL